MKKKVFHHSGVADNKVPCHTLECMEGVFFHSSFIRGTKRRSTASQARSRQICCIEFYKIF